MEALRLAGMAREFLPQLDGNVGVGKRRDETMPQAVEAPRRTLCPALPWADWRAIPAATPARAMMRLKALLAPAPGRCANDGNSEGHHLPQAGA